MEPKACQGQIILECALILFTFSLLLFLVIDFHSPKFGKNGLQKEYLGSYRNKKPHKIKDLQFTDFTKFKNEGRFK